MLFGLLLSPAMAANTETDRLLWCASAFNWLARDADDAADATSAAIFDAWATRFTERGAAALQAAGLSEAKIEAEIARYDEEVLGEMQAKAMRYDVETCPALLPEPPQ